MPSAYISKEDIIAAQQEVANVVFPKEMQQIYVKLRKSLRAESFHISDRTYKISVKLLKAEAWLHGREMIDTPDFEVLKHVIWTMPDQRKKAQSLILDIIAPEKNRVYEILENCNSVYSKVFEKKAAKERINEAMEALGNMKKASLEITKLKNIIAQRGTSIDEIVDVEKKIEAMKRTLLVDELGSTTLL